MRALSEYAKLKGHTVSGSDINIDSLDYLKSIDIKIYNYPNLNEIEKADVVIYSSSISEDNVELQKAKKLKKKIYERSEYLAEISKKCARSIFIAGSHGKSSVTSIICRSLDKMGYGLIGHVGAEYIDRKSNLIYTGENLIVSEACEYKKNFLNFNPTILTVLNIDYDHPDSYVNEKELIDAYLSLAKSSKQVLVHENISSYFKENNIKCITFGKGENVDYKYDYLKLSSREYLINIYNKNSLIFSFNINTLQEHDILNFAAAAVTVLVLKTQTILPKMYICNELLLKRRCEEIGTINNVKVVLDYAHHPRQILSTYLSFKKKYNKILCVFQPHTFSRTESLFSDFVSSLCVIEHLLILPTFAAREVSSIDPIYKLKNFLDKSRVQIVRSHNECAEYIKTRSKEYDLILLLGAGDIYKICDMLNMDNSVNNERCF